MSGLKKRLLRTVLAASAFGAAPAFAANDAMLELLRVLKEKGTLDAQAYEALVNAAKADDEHVTYAKDEIKRMQKETPKIDTKGKLEISSPDGDFKWRIGGRVHADAAFYDNDTGDGGETTTLASGADVRRTRLDVTATLWKAWQLKVQYDFADNGDQIDEGIRDAYLKYTLDTVLPVTFTAGHFKEFITLEEITSSNDITFIERSMAAQAFDASNGRRLGAGVNTYGNDLWTLSAGIFGRQLGTGENDLGGTDDDSDPILFTGRATFSPIHAQNRVAHIGVAGSYYSPEDDNAFRFRARPEANIGADRLIDTGTLLGDHVTRYGVEAAGVYGPFSLQGEYLRTDLTGDEVGDPDVSFDGWYVFGSWILTGESRVYSFEDGVFKNPKPNGIVGKGGIGAWELALRYSSLDLSDSDGTIVVDGGKEDNLTVGLNWYPTPNFKFMANYVKVLDLEFDTPGAGLEGAEPSAFQLRAQAYW
ncbi:MAG: OprO/OprP family phosphate-selective porin [Chromatiales bacterium]